jgi:hypothetical protein
MSAVFKNFRGDVTGRSTKCGRERFLANDLCQAKIGQLNMEIFIRK